MPLYDYHCPQCGSFTAWNPMSRASTPEACPSCAVPAPRAVIAPYLNTMDSHNRIAHQRNENSADAPTVMSREQLHGVSRTGGHRHGCHHDHGPNRNTGAERLTGSTAYRQSNRRSVIGH